MLLRIVEPTGACCHFCEMMTMQQMMTNAIAVSRSNILKNIRRHCQDSITGREENRNSSIVNEDHFEGCTALGTMCSVESDDGSLKMGDIVRMAKYVGDIVILRKVVGYIVIKNSIRLK